MKLVLDSCVWGGALGQLQSLGHDVIWTGDWDKDPGDQAILEYAHKHDRTLVTLDKDFGELAIVFGELHCGIIRLVGVSARTQADYCAAVIDRYGKELASGAIVTANETKTRVRMADSSSS